MVVLSKDIESGTTTLLAEDFKQKSMRPQNVLWWNQQPIQLTYGLTYCFFSMSMILTNKLLLSSFDFKAPNTLLLFQFLTTVLLIDISGQFGYLQRDPLDWKVIKIWWPANIIFVAMIGTGFYTLQTVNVPMVTLMKNCTNLLIILGDLIFFGKRYSLGVWASLALMILSAFVGGYTDITFELTGYSWLIANCVVTAAYSLFLKQVLKRVEEITADQGKLKDISKVYYNHLLGLPWLIFLIVVVGEPAILFDQPAWQDRWFLVAVGFSGLAGFAISFSMLRFLSVTTPTTFAMTSTLSKIPTAILGWVLFSVPTTILNVASVLVGLCSATVFVLAKATERK